MPVSDSTASTGPPLETTAGHGTTLGRSFAELGELLARLPEDRCGCCWDTAHLWAAGHDLTSDEGYTTVWSELASATGRHAPELVHLNDTNVECGSRRDRHERIGHGLLGEQVFARLLHDPRLRSVPMVLETPKGNDGVTWDREALELLKTIRAGPPARHLPPVRQLCSDGAPPVPGAQWPHHSEPETPWTSEYSALPAAVGAASRSAAGGW